MEIRRKFALTRPQGNHWPIGKVDLGNYFKLMMHGKLRSSQLSA